MHDNFTYMKKLYAHKIVSVNLSKIYFLKSAKKTCKPNNRQIKSRFNNQIVRKDRRICSTGNTYFTNVTNHLQIQQVLLVNKGKLLCFTEIFSSKSISKNDIIERSQKLPSNKASILNDVPVSIIKDFAICYCEASF